MPNDYFVPGNIIELDTDQLLLFDSLPSTDLYAEGVLLMLRGTGELYKLLSGSWVKFGYALLTGAMFTGDVTSQTGLRVQPVLNDSGGAVLGVNGNRVFLAPYDASGVTQFDKEITYDPAVGQWNIEGAPKAGGLPIVNTAGATFTGQVIATKLRVTDPADGIQNESGFLHLNRFIDNDVSVGLDSDSNLRVNNRLVANYAGNSNGEYIRFYEGTQICWIREGLAGGVTTGTWTFPAAFATVPFPWFSFEDAGAGQFSDSKLSGPPSLTSANFSLESNVDGKALRMFAIGRWY